MTHGISEQQWLDYLDQQLDSGERARVELHLAGCVECREFHSRISRTVKSLQEMGVEMRHGFPLDDEQLHISLAKVLARVLDAEARRDGLSQADIEERLNHLEDCLALMCGSWTAVNALRVAARNSIHDSLGQLTEDNWPVFLKRLTSIASVFCGDSGAKLVWEYGKL